VKRTVAIPVWQDRVSTTLDFARGLLVVQAAGGREISRQELGLSEEPAERRARRIRSFGVQIVLCGAVSRSLAEAIVREGMQIIPFVSGAVDSVLAAYLCGRLEDPRFLQPGCPPGARKRWQHGGELSGL